MGKWHRFTGFLLFQQVDPTEMDRMLDPKRTRFFFNASTGNESNFTNIKSRNEKLLYFRSGKFFIMLICIWAYEGRGDRGVEVVA